MLKKNPFVTAKEISKEIAITEEGVRYYLNRFKKEGIIKRVGSRKKGHWEVIK
jgi:ATP-dependent DNA helicase RecG